MNQELIAHLRELLKRVEACPFDLEKGGVDIDMYVYSTNEQVKPVAESLSDICTAKVNENGWYRGKVGGMVSITVFNERLPEPVVPLFAEAVL